MESSDSSELSFDELSESESDSYGEYLIKDLEIQLNEQKNITDYLTRQNDILHNSLSRQNLFNMVLIVYSTILTLFCFK